MRLPLLVAGIAIAAAAGVPCCAQSCVEKIEPVFRNLDFSEGQPGEHPPGWGPSDPACYQPPHAPNPVETVSGWLCYTGPHCAVLRSAPPVVPAGDEVVRYIALLRAPHQNTRVGLIQSVDVTAYRGKTLTFRAAMRAEVPRGSEARLFVRIHHEDGTTGFFDDMGRFPVRSSAWHFYEIPAPIGRDAGDVEFGMTLTGQGEAWIDHLSVDITNPEK